jgi:hypothetical protein
LWEKRVQKGLSLIFKPKLTKEGKVPKGELRAPPHHPRLKLKKLDNAFHNELGKTYK